MDTRYDVYEFDVTGVKGFERRVVNADDAGFATADEAWAYIASHQPTVPANFFFVSKDRVPMETMQRLKVT